jgi:N-dimethylarginine dimethylaminohydrolase
MWGRLERVLVRRPLAEDAARWREYGWHGAPDTAAALREHEAFCLALEAAGAEVIVSQHDPGNPDALYTYDPVLVGDEGAVLLRPGKEGRLGEREGIAAALEAAGVPVVAEVSAPATAEGGDTLWLDHDTLLVGHGYRTGAAGVAALRACFPDAQLVTFDLPHWNGAGEVMHLMSFISPLDRDLAVVYPRLAPVRLLELLAERGIGLVEVPDDEFASMGANVLALGPRRALALEGNDETRRRMERAGVDVATYRGDEISRKGDGGPTCLTRPLLRVPCLPAVGARLASPSPEGRSGLTPARRSRPTSAGGSR